MVSIANYTFFYKEQNSLASTWMFLNISSNPAFNVLRCFSNLKTSNNCSIPDQAIVMQDKECSGFVRHIMDVHSNFLLV